MRADAKALKEKLSIVKVERIDEEVAKLEHQLGHTSLSLNEEKRKIEQIGQLRKSREFVAEYDAKMSKVSEDESARQDVFARMKAKDAEINALKVVEAEAKKELDDQRKQEDEKMADVPAMAEERNATYTELKEVGEQMRALRDDFRKEEDKYYSAEREFRAQDKERRQAEYEERVAQRKERELEKKKRLAEMAPPPYAKELYECESLLTYMQSLLDKHAAPAAVKEDAPKDFSALDGLVARKRDEDVFFMGGGGKKKGKKGKKDKPKDASLTHAMDTYASFATLKLDVPVKVSEVCASMEAIREKQAHFIKKQEEKLAAKKAAEERGEEWVDPDEPKPKKAAKENGAAEGKTSGEESTAEDAEADAKEDAKEEGELATDGPVDLEEGELATDGPVDLSGDAPYKLQVELAMCNVKKIDTKAYGIEKPDCTATVAIGDQSFTTRTERGLDPQWDQTVILGVTDPSKDRLSGKFFMNQGTKQIGDEQFFNLDKLVNGKSTFKGIIVPGGKVDMFVTALGWGAEEKEENIEDMGFMNTLGDDDAEGGMMMSDSDEEDED